MAANKGPTDAQLAKIDAYELTAADYEEIPEVTEEMFARGVLHIGGVPVKRGRPPVETPKQAVNLRLSQRVLNGFREDGPGWQTRINAELEQWLDERKAGG